MSIIIREKSRIKRFDNYEEFAIFRSEDMRFDHIDDYHVRIQKLFPFCHEERDPSLSSYKRFHLRFYIPLNVFQDKYKRIKKCFIIFNGLDEIDHYTLYDQLGKGLCKNGYGAILLPLPDHLNRNSEYRFNDELKRMRPSEAFIKEPKKIYDVYSQFIDEVRILLNHLTDSCGFVGHNGCCQFYKQFFDQNVTISLLGYSLGGLSALSNFLVQKFNFNSCILLNSGAQLNDIDVSEFQSVGKWKDTVKELSKTHYELDNGNNVHRLFDMTFLGNNLIGLKDELQESCRKVLFVLGGADSVTKFRSIRKIEPDDHGLAILKVPGLHHFLSIDTHWDQWFPLVMDIITSFDNSASHDSLLPNDILSSLIYFQLKYRVSDRLDHFDLNRIEDKFERDSFSRTLFAAKGTYGAISSSFVEMYKLLLRAKKRPHLYPDYIFNQHDNLFGNVASKLYKIDDSMIRNALKKQSIYAKKAEQIPYIGEILIDDGVLSPENVNHILETISEGTWGA